MTKRVLAWMVVLAMCLCAFTACGGSKTEQTQHTHTWQDYASAGEQGHYQTCTGCDAHTATVAHNFDNDSDIDCNNCGFTRELDVQVQEPDTTVNTQDQEVLAELSLRFEEDPTYDQDLTLYADGTFCLHFPNSEEEDWIAEYSISGDEITLDLWGEKNVGTVTTDDAGNIVSVNVEVFGESCEYKAANDNILAELSLRFEEDPTYDQDLTLYADGTFCLHFPNSEEEDWIAEYSISGDEITLDLWGEKNVGTVTTDASGNIVSVNVEVFGESCEYKAANDNILAELPLRFEEDPTYDQDLTLYADGTFCLHFPNTEEEDWIAEYSISGDEITLDLWGEKVVGELFTDSNGNVIAVRAEVFGEDCVYGEIPA